MDDDTKSNDHSTPEQKSKEQSPAEHIKGFLGWMSPANISALYVISIGISVLFDTIYLRALGISIMVAPISIADHIRSSVIWVPPVLIASTATLIVSTIWSWFHEGLLSNTYKMFISFILLLLIFALTLFAMWWWIWYIATPYDFSFAKEALDFLKSIMIQLVIMIFVIVIMVASLIFPIYRGKKNFEKAMNFRRTESIVLSASSLTLFMSFLMFTIHISAEFSGLGACGNLPQKASITIDNKEPKFVLLRSFGKHLLIANCVEDPNCIEFIKVDKIDSIRVCKQNKQEQDATEQTENSGADPNSTNSPTPPVAAWLLQLSAEQR